MLSDDLKAALSPAMVWALKGVIANPGLSPARLGEHMSERPGMTQAGPARLTKAQGFGRLGASMAARLRKLGLAEQRPAHRSGPTYTATFPTEAGRRALNAEQAEKPNG